MNLNRIQFYEQSVNFVAAMLTNLAKDGITPHPGSIDHLCYRAETQQSYHQAMRLLNQWGGFLSENQIGGRPVSVFLLDRAVNVGDHSINCIELTAPKHGSAYVEGFEHIEVVVTQPLTALIQRYPQLNFDSKGLTKSFNADLRLRYPDGSVKFHNLPLPEVIELERQQG